MLCIPDMPVITIPGLELRIPAMETGLESLKFIPSWKVDAYLSEFLSKNISAILSGEQSPMLSCDEGDGIQTSIGHKGMEPKVCFLVIKVQFLTILDNND